MVLGSVWHLGVVAAAYHAQDSPTAKNVGTQTVHRAEAEHPWSLEPDRASSCVTLWEPLSLSLTRSVSTTAVSRFVVRINIFNS